MLVSLETLTGGSAMEYGRASKEAAMNATRKIELVLPESLIDLVDRKIASGDYSSRSDVIAEGLLALDAHEAAIDTWLRDEVVPTYHRVMSGEEDTLSFEEVAAKFVPRKI